MRSPEYQQLSVATARRYLPGGRFAHGFARGKLSNDPVFEYLLTSGLLSEDQRILDLGCGQGLLAALLVQARAAASEGSWPAHWPAPSAAAVHGIELMASDVARAEAALAGQASFETGNIADTAFAPCDTVVILDVLHYLPYKQQDDVLRRVHAALSAQGKLVLRIGDADGGFGFRWSNWVDHVVTWCRGHRLPRLYCRSVAQWQQLLEQLGFTVEIKPMSEGTMFANVLLLARKQA